MRGLAVWFLVSALSAASWILCETLGGLAFLAAGVRLWSYHLLPLFWDITSPVIWLIVFLLMGPFMLLYGSLERAFPAARRSGPRLLYLVTVGPVAEVLINELLFKRLLGGPLYTYTALPTFDGSGSVLSPFYYATLYIHYPLTAWLLRRLPPADGTRLAEA